MTYIFDFDGTLVDSMKQWAAKMLHVLEENNIDYPDDIIKTITPLGDRATAKYFIELGVKMSVEEILTLMAKYAIDEYTYRIPLKPHVKEKLEELKKDGHSLNVLTASPHMMLDVCLKRVGVYDMFDNVWSCDDFEYTKSDKRIYPEAAKRIGTDMADCVFLDDNYNAVLAAHQAGMKTIGVYDDSSAEYESQIREVTDGYIFDFSEL